MSSKLHLVSANLCDKLSTAAEDIARTGADIYGFAEALPITATDAEREALREAYATFGYATYFVPSDDVDRREDQHYLALLIRRRLDYQVKPIYLDTRNALTVMIGSLLVVLVHFDDRLEASRRVQARQLQYYINDLRNQGTVSSEIVMGDFNATYPTSLGRIVNAAAQCWEWLGLPSHEPDDPDRTWLGRRGGLLTRLGGMMTSKVLQTFEEMDFVDADSRCQATMPSTFPIAQLDHVLLRGVTVHSFELNEFADSDHLALDVVVEATM